MEERDMTSTTLDARTGDSVATKFLDALARQDWSMAQSLLDKEVSFRVLTPRALREADDDTSTIAWLARWFGDADELITLRSEISTMHDRVSLSYRFHVHKDRWYVIEQRGYADVLNGKIMNLNLVCSGFRPA
jgi:hypothetical protein